VKVVVEMPGVSEENLNIQFNGSMLTIEAAGETRTYRSTTNLPPVDPVSRHQSLKNGVLEVTFESLSDSPIAD
jgi:HSP20 family protein